MQAIPYYRILYITNLKYVRNSEFLCTYPNSLGSNWHSLILVAYRFYVVHGKGQQWYHRNDDWRQVSKFSRTIKNHKEFCISIWTPRKRVLHTHKLQNMQHLDKHQTNRTKVFNGIEFANGIYNRQASIRYLLLPTLLRKTTIKRVVQC